MSTFPSIFPLLCLFLLFTTYSLVSGNKWTDRGLPDTEWTSWEDAKQGSKINKKPIMTLFTKSWCEESTKLKESLRASTRFLELCEYFNLVSVEEPEELMEEIGFFCTDGDYTPRAYFAHNTGYIEPRVTSGRTELKFLYLDAQSLEQTMEHIINNGFPTFEKEEL
eukprot:TRINITY_DN19480_c0_g1_i1.p1 TRINITY_DN19480_c0_g1~~TRINITY_DN19480_c0_g1_i1.p1  ORF type:complete len:166 (-),score=36.02 TRINITY_DN19480_c0_g1_i1:19-516(-)